MFPGSIQAEMSSSTENEATSSSIPTPRTKLLAVLLDVKDLMRLGHKQFIIV